MTSSSTSTSARFIGSFRPVFPECGEAFRNGRRKRWTRSQNIVKKMQCKVGATIYLTGHCVRYETDEELTAYASNVADRLEYLIYEKGLSNVKIYCMSNELSLDDWGRPCI